MSGFLHQKRPGFTTVELLVSMAVMIVAMVGVVGIFNISSSAAGRTNAHADLLEAASALQNELSHQLSQITPGLLIIESPPPTTVRSEVPGGPAFLRLRHDRLVFIASAAADEYQSAIDPRRGRPDDPLGTSNPDFRPPASSREALVYFGPGIPATFEADGTPILRNIDSSGIGLPDRTLTASEWMFVHRAILLLSDTATPGWNPTPPDVTLFTAVNGMLDGAPLDARYRESRMDVVLSALTGERAMASTLIDAIRNKSIAGRDSDANPSPIHSLWQANWSILKPRLTIPPTPLSPPDLYPPDYYMRTGNTFIPRLADFRIEWTDGRRVDPLGPDGIENTGDEDYRTRWFGLAPDAGSAPNPNDPLSVNLMSFRSRMRLIAGPDGANVPNPSNPNLVNPDNPAEETAAFANIEWSPAGIDADQFAQYRAVWRPQNWLYRPKALRFTYRLYDAGNRLFQPSTTDLDNDGINDPDLQPTKATVIRYGQEFSIVVPLP